MNKIDKLNNLIKQEVGNFLNKNIDDKKIADIIVEEYIENKSNIEEIYNYIFDLRKNRKNPYYELFTKVALKQQNDEDITADLINLKIKDFAQKKLMKKKMEFNRKKDLKEIEGWLINELKNHEGKRFRSKELRAKLKDKFPNNQFNNYEMFRTRNNIYRMIAKAREEMRMEEFNDGYVISGKVIKLYNEDENKVDGWMFTRNKMLIKEYLETEISTHEASVDSFNHFLKILLASISKENTLVKLEDETIQETLGEF